MGVRSAKCISDGENSPQWGAVYIPYQPVDCKYVGQPGFQADRPTCPARETPAFYHCKAWGGRAHTSDQYSTLHIIDLAMRKWDVMVSRENNRLLRIFCCERSGQATLSLIYIFSKYVKVSEGFEKRGKTTAYDICGPCGPVFGVVYSPPLSSKSRPRPSRRLSCCPRHLSTPRRDTPRPLYVRGISDAPNILLDKSAYYPFLLHFPCRGCLNPHLCRQSARDAARRTRSTTDGPEFVRADATATRKCKNTDS